jgi:two-component system LytT family response regulator
MELLTALIVDDEIHNRSVLKTLLETHFPEIHIAGEAENVRTAHEKIEELKPKLLFLDIKMPGKSGFDLLKMFDAIDFDVSKLKGVVEKAIAKIKTNQVNENVFHFIKTLEEKNDLINKIPVHHNEKVVLLNVRDLISVEVKDAVCELRLVNGMQYYSSKDLKLFEDMLEKIGDFIRINKSVIINTNHIKAYSKGEICIIEMVSEASFDVSRRKKTEVLRKVKFL